MSEQLGEFGVKKRRSGETHAFCFVSYPSLVSGGSIGILGNDEDYVKRIQSIFKNTFNLETEYQPITRLEPHNPMKFVYDQFGEIEDVYFVRQERIVTGFTITAKPINNPSRP